MCVLPRESVLTCFKAAVHTRLSCLPAAPSTGGCSYRELFRREDVFVWLPIASTTQSM